MENSVPLFIAATWIAWPSLPSRRRSRRAICRSKVIIGIRLLEAKASLPRGHFRPWLEKQKGLSRGMALQCMTLEKEARQKAIKARAA